MLNISPSQSKSFYRGVKQTSGTGLRRPSFKCWRKGAGKRAFECTKGPNSKYWFTDGAGKRAFDCAKGLISKYWFTEGAGKQGFECNKGPISKYWFTAGAGKRRFECTKGLAGVSGEQFSHLIQSIHFAVCTKTVTLN